MFRLLRRMPLLRLLAIAQLARLARSHFMRLEPADRRRLGELVRRGRGLSPAERDELRRLIAKVEPRAFAAAVAGAFSPVPLPRRLAGKAKGAGH